MQTTNLSIPEILRRAKEKSLTIPQFQRPFVWSESQVKLLIDSVSRAYPIGSLLLLTKSPKIELHSRSIEAVIREGYPSDDLLADPESKSSDQYFILDGQQRLTSIVRVFMNAHPKKTYYFDIKALIDEYKIESASWIVARLRGKQDPDRKEKNRLVRSDITLDQAKADIYITEYIEDSGDFADRSKDEMRSLAARVKGVFERIRNYQVPIVTIERDAEIESVCRIFETINSTGTRLTTFDLAVAKFFPKPDLRAMWENAIDSFPTLKEFEVDGERALQVIALVQAAKDARYVEVTRGELLGISPATIEQTWQSACEALEATYLWAKRNGARPPHPPSHGTLVAIAGLEALDPGFKTKIDSGLDLAIRKWYFCKVMQQGARGASNYKIAQDFQNLLNSHRGVSSLEYEAVSIQARSITKLYRAADVRFRGLQALLHSSIRFDLYSGRALVDGPTEEHHIFPRAALKKAQVGVEFIDSIANKVPISKETNRNLSDRPPVEAFQKRLVQARNSGTLDALQSLMDDCLIPGRVVDPEWILQFEIKNYSNFLENRAALISKKLRSIVGDALVDSPDEFDEDD